MEKSIAQLKLQAVSRDGAKTDFTLAIGAPKEESDGTWACEIDAPAIRPKPFCVYGEDSMQSLCLAIYLVRQELQRLGKGGRLLFDADPEGGQDIEFPFKAYFPPAPSSRR